MIHSKFSIPRYGPFTANPGFFPVQIVGESMNRRIPHGGRVRVKPFFLLYLRHSDL